MSQGPPAMESHMPFTILLSFHKDKNIWEDAVQNKCQTKEFELNSNYWGYE